MTWANFYLICFAVGFALSLLSFLSGSLRWHLPHFPHGHVSLPHASHGPAAVAHAGAGKGPVRGSLVRFRHLTL